MIEVEINFVLKNVLVSLKFNFEPSSMKLIIIIQVCVKWFKSFDDCHCVKFYINLQFIVKRNPTSFVQRLRYSAELSRCQSSSVTQWPWLCLCHVTCSLIEMHDEVCKTPRASKEVYSIDVFAQQDLNLLVIVFGRLYFPFYLLFLLDL